MTIANLSRRRLPAARSSRDLRRRRREPLALAKSIPNRRADQAEERTGAASPTAFPARSGVTTSSDEPLERRKTHG
jgi:hypothetical protein